MNIKFILSTLMAGICLMPCGATDITLLPDTTVMKNATATKSIELKTGNPTAITGKTGTLDIDWKKASVTPAAEGLQCTYEGNWKTYAITLSVNEQGYVASDFIRTETNGNTTRFAHFSNAGNSLPALWTEMVPPIFITDMTVTGTEGNLQKVALTYNQLKEKHTPGNAYDRITFVMADGNGKPLSSKDFIFGENPRNDANGNLRQYKSGISLPLTPNATHLEARYAGHLLAACTIEATASAPVGDIYFNTDRQTVTFTAEGDYQAIKVTTNATSWKVTANEWCKEAAKDAASFTLKARPNNTGKERRGTAKVTDANGKVLAEIALTQPSQATSPGKALINKVRTKVTNDDKGVRGLAISVKADVMNMQGRKAVCTARLFDAMGRKVMDKNGKYSDSEGQVAVSTEFTTREQFGKETVINLFIPETELEVDLDKGKYQLNIEIADTTEGTKTIGRLDNTPVKKSLLDF